MLNAIDKSDSGMLYIQFRDTRHIIGSNEIESVN